MIIRNNILKLPDGCEERVIYADPAFRCYSQYVYMPGDPVHRTTEHWNEEIEYIYVKSGKFVCFVNGERIELRENEGICVNSKRIHSNESVPGQGCELYLVIMHPGELSASRRIREQYVLPMVGPGSFDYLLLQTGNWTEKLLPPLRRLFETNPESPLEIAILETAFEMLGLMWQYLPPSERRVREDPHEEPFKQMMAYIDRHYAEKITLDDIAAQGGTGKTLCTAIFRKYTGETPVECLIRRRIEAGTEALLGSGGSIAGIAYACGFSSASHFTEVFRKKMGCTPREYRTERKAH